MLVMMSSWKHLIFAGLVPIVLFYSKVALATATLFSFEVARNESMERIINDLVSFENGVHVDFSYNETLMSMISAPGCPKSHEGRPWVYYGSPPKCYLVGFRGPCPLGRRMFAMKNSMYGVCNCDCFASYPSSSDLGSTAGVGVKMEKVPAEPAVENEIFIIPRSSRSEAVLTNSNTNQAQVQSTKMCNTTKSKRTAEMTTTEETKNEGPRYQFCFSSMLQRLVAFDELRQECHAFLDQGPCHKGEWLVRNMEKEGVNAVQCEKRKCPEYTGYTDKDGGWFTYFDYRRQECQRQAYGSFQESFFANIGGIISDRQKYCMEAGMKYSTLLKTCVRNHKNQFNFMIG